MRDFPGGIQDTNANVNLALGFCADSGTGNGVGVPVVGFCCAAEVVGAIVGAVEPSASCLEIFFIFSVSNSLGLQISAS